MRKHSGVMSYSIIIVNESQFSGVNGPHAISSNDMLQFIYSGIGACQTHAKFTRRTHDGVINHRAMGNQQSMNRLQGHAFQEIVIWCRDFNILDLLGIDGFAFISESNQVIDRANAFFHRNRGLQIIRIIVYRR